MESKSQGFGNYEIQDWNGCDWGTIEGNIVHAFDENSGEELPNGASVIEMGIDKNSFGCYRIEGLDMKVYDINQIYADYANDKESGGKPGKIDYDLSNYVIDNFMMIDTPEFKKHSKINISFNKDWFTPDVLSAKCGFNNYFKIDIAISNVKSIFDQHEEKFNFESISEPGTSNVSISSSIKQCLADAKVMKKMMGNVIYSIYVKSESK